MCYYIPGECHSLALSSSGNVYSWGYNTDGQLGHQQQQTEHAAAAAAEVEDDGDHYHGTTNDDKPTAAAAGSIGSATTAVIHTRDIACVLGPGLRNMSEAVTQV